MPWILLGINENVRQDGLVLVDNHFVKLLTIVATGEENLKWSKQKNGLVELKNQAERFGSTTNARQSSQLRCLLSALDKVHGSISAVFFGRLVQFI